MREAGDGPAGFLPLVILPAVWLALYGTRRQLLIALAATALVLLVPWAVVGGERYTAGTPRNALLALTVAALAGLTIQQLLGQVRAERDFNDGVLDTAGSLVIVTDRDARIERFNRAAERSTGFAAADMIGRSLIATLMPPESRDAVAPSSPPRAPTRSRATTSTSWSPPAAGAASSPGR